MLVALVFLALSLVLAQRGNENVSGAMSAADLQALLRLRAAQPPSVQGSCYNLAHWHQGSHTAPCDWPGVTCTAAGPAGPAGNTGAMGVHRRVTVIDLRYCGLTSLPGAALAALDHLEVLEVRGNNITVLPEAIGNLTALQRIMLEMNDVSELPPQICSLKHLTNLYVAYNQLTALPPCIGSITTLRDIWLRGNNISTLPDSFCELSMLDSLYIMRAGLTRLPDCFGDVGKSWGSIHLELEGNRLTSLPESMANMYRTGRLHDLALAGNRLTALPAWVGGMLAANITSINAERNEIRELPSSLPPNLKSLRLWGNPLTGATRPQKQALFQLLQDSEDLSSFSISMAGGGQGAAGWDGLDNDFVVTAMPGIEQGTAKCTHSSGSSAGCAFEIKTDWNSNAYSSGGLDLHFCLNTTAGCGCEQTHVLATPGEGVGGGVEAQPPIAPLCVPLEDHHDGSYGGVIDPRTVGQRFASFRFFQRSYSNNFANSTLHEVVIGMWVSDRAHGVFSMCVRCVDCLQHPAECSTPVLAIALANPCLQADGSDCVGGVPDDDFQSRGGNCFRNIEFVLDCSAHGPFAHATTEGTVATAHLHVPQHTMSTEAAWPCVV